VSNKNKKIKKNSNNVSRFCRRRSSVGNSEKSLFDKCLKWKVSQEWKGRKRIEKYNFSIKEVEIPSPGTKNSMLFDKSLTIKIEN